MDERQLLLVTFVVVAVGVSVALLHLESLYRNRPLTYTEEVARRILLSKPSTYVTDIAMAIINQASRETLVYYRQWLIVESGVEVKLQYYCPLGVKVRVLPEPELEPVSHLVNAGACTTVLRNNRAEPVEVTVTVYSYGWELVGDEAFRVYAVLRWVSENLRYIPDPKGSDIIFKPDETLKRGGGDCEDIALATAVLLRALNMSAGVALVNTGQFFQVADHVAVAIKPLTPVFMNNLRVYFDASTVRCSPVTAKGYIILDPVLAASSITPWCVPYSQRDLHSIVSDEYIQLRRDFLRP